MTFFQWLIHSGYLHIVITYGRLYAAPKWLWLIKLDLTISMSHKKINNNKLNSPQHYLFKMSMSMVTVLTVSHSRPNFRTRQSVTVTVIRQKLIVSTVIWLLLWIKHASIFLADVNWTIFVLPWRNFKRPRRLTFAASEITCNVLVAVSLYHAAFPSWRQLDRRSP